MRRHHQRPRDRDPLLLAARELVRVLARLLGQADARRAARARAAPPRPAAASGSAARRASGCRITVRCGKRLNCWKTIPIRCRTAETSTPFAVISSPSKKMRPAWIGSSRLTQRSSVLLPLPLGPMITSTSPAATSRSIPSRTRLSPKLLRTPSSRRTGPRCRAGLSASAACVGAHGALAVRCRRVDGFRHRMSDSRQRPVGSQVRGHLVSVGRQVYSRPARRQATRSDRRKTSSPRGANRMKQVLIACVAVAAFAVTGRRAAGAARAGRDHVHRLSRRVRTTAGEPQEASRARSTSSCPRGS